MTLIVAVCNYWNVIQVSDRRLTLNGRPWDDTGNKCLIVGCRDAILSVTYTGLAYVGEVPTDDWILGVIDSNGGQHRDMGFVVDLLARAATSAFASEVPQSDRGSALTMLVAGWHWKKKRIRAYTWWITNCDVTSPAMKPTQTFVKGYFRSKWPARVGEGKGGFAAGARAAIEAQSWRNLSETILGEKDANRLISGMVSVVRRAADHPVHGHVIGKDCLAVVLPRSGGESVYSEYWPNDSSPLFYSPGIITPNIRGPSLEMVGGGMTIHAGGKTMEIRGTNPVRSQRVVWGFRPKRPRRRPG